MSYFAFFAGALIPTVIISRIILVLMKGWDGGARRLVIAHMISLMACVLLGGMGMADGGAFAGMIALIQYTPAQAFWLLADICRNRRTQRKQAAQPQAMA